MKDRKLLRLSVLVLVCLVLTACGKTTPTPVPPTEVSAVEPTIAEVPTTEAAAADTNTTANECPIPVDMSTAQLPDNPKSITIAFSQEPDNAVNMYSSMAYTMWLNQIIGVGVAQWDDKNDYVTQLATEIPSVENGGISEDGLTITWHLKPCLYWSDGEPLTSHDLVFTWQQEMDPDNSPYLRYGYEKIDSIETPDDQTVIIRFKEAFPAWTTLFVNGANTASNILPAHILEGKKHLEMDPFIHSPNVGAGPFVLTEWISGDHMTLTANPNYYRGKPKLDQIIIKFVPDPETAMAAIRTGDINLSPDFSVGDVPTLQEMAPAVEVMVEPTQYLEFFFPNYGTTDGVTLEDGTVVGKSDQNGPCALQDAKVRRAILLGIDRQAIVDNLLYGMTTIPVTMWSNSVWANTSLAQLPYDPEAANQLLDEAGYSSVGADGIRTGTCNGEEVRLSFGIMTTNKQLRIDQTTAMQSDLKKIGIELIPDLMPGGTFFSSYTDGGPVPTGDFDIAGFYDGRFPDPDPGTSFLCEEVPSADKPEGANWFLLCDPVMDELARQVSTTVDPVKRKEALDALQLHMYDETYIFPLYSVPFIVAYTSNLEITPISGNGGWAWDVYNWDLK